MPLRILLLLFLLYNIFSNIIDSLFSHFHFFDFNIIIINIIYNTTFIIFYKYFNKF